MIFTTRGGTAYGVDQIAGGICRVCVAGDGLADAFAREQLVCAQLVA